MKRSRTGLVLLLCLLAAGSGAWWRGHDSNSASKTAPSSNASDTPAKATEAVASSPTMPSDKNSTPPPAASDGRTGPRFKRAYMLSLDNGALALVDAQDIEGDFAPRRGKEEEWSNMLRFRLLSETREVLAEELLPAPDQVCRVLDPRSADGKAVTLTNTGPVVFQVRMPRVKGARQLDIYRILQPGEPATENLLGSLPLPRS